MSDNELDANVEGNDGAIPPAVLPAVLPPPNGPLLEPRNDHPGAPARQRRRIDDHPPGNAARALNPGPPSNLYPMDPALRHQNAITRYPDQCSLSDLNEDQKSLCIRTDNRYLDFQIIRIVMTQPNKPANVFVRSKTGSNKRGGVAEQQNGRMFLCRIYEKDDYEASGELFYFMQTKTINDRIWNRDLNARDNGTFTIGTYLRVLAPDFITSYLNNEVPMITCSLPAILMKRPETIQAIPIVNLSINQSRGYVLNSAQLFIQKLQPIAAPCNGHMCDKQRIVEMRGGKCSCYSWRDQRTRCVFNHSIVVTPADRTSTSAQRQIVDANFSSQTFSQFYLNKPVPNTVRLSQLQESNDFYEITDAVHDICGYVNRHGGWTVVGWYRLGMVTDRGLAGSEGNSNQYGNNPEPEAQVEAGETKVHVIQIYPTRPTFFQVGHNDYNYLVETKFNTDSMNI